MQIYTYSEARQNLASVLKNAKKTGKVVIRRRDGSQFSLTPEGNDSSPFDVPSIRTQATLDDIMTSIKDSRSRIDKK